LSTENVDIGTNIIFIIHKITRLLHASQLLVVIGSIGLDKCLA